MTRANRSALARRIQDCRICAADLPLGPRPVVSFVRRSRILLVGHAPGIRVHQSGRPWSDPSGDRLRAWLGVTDEQFYDAANFAIVPMGFCYPGRGKSGDNPPRPECAAQWMEPVRAYLSDVRLTLLSGAHAQAYFLGDRRKRTLTETVRAWQEYAPSMFVLPHPSPRNNIWLKKNQWFENDVLGHLRGLVQRALA